MLIHTSVEEGHARFLSCIAEPTRLQILKLLASGERYVGEIAESLSKEQSLISHHLKVLKSCNIVKCRQEAQKTYFSIADERIARLIFESEALMKKLSTGSECSECCESQTV